MPIVVNNRLWGAMMALSTARTPQPPSTEAHQELQQLADEQAELRAVATLVAQGAEPRAVFDAVCEATGRLIGAASVNLAQFTPDEFSLTQAG